jgi:hypothetical protein
MVGSAQAVVIDSTILIEKSWNGNAESIRSHEHNRTDGIVEIALFADWILPADGKQAASKRASDQFLDGCGS